MNITTDLRVFDKFGPFLRLLGAYNRGNFRDSINWRRRLQNVGFASYASVMLIAFPLFGILIVWLLIENDLAWRRCAIALPLMISLFQVALTFIALMIKNRSIEVIFSQLQQVVDDRKWFFGANFP